MGGKSQPSETTQKVEPWDGAKPYLTGLYSDAQKLYNQGVPNYFPGKNVIDQSSNTLDALKQTENLAKAGSPIAGTAQNSLLGILNGSGLSQTPTNTYQSLQNGIALGANPAASGANAMAYGQPNAPGTSTLNQGMAFNNPGQAATQSVTQSVMGQSPYANPALGQVAGLAGQATANPAMAGYQSAAGFTNAAMGAQTAQAQQLQNANNPATSMLEQTANGSMLNANPYLNQAIKNSNSALTDQFKTEIAPGIDSQFAGSGRMGSNAYAASRNKAEGTLASAMSSNANNIMMQNYGTERTNQLAAQNTMGQLYNQDVDNSMRANSALASTSDAQQAQRLAGINGVGSTFNQGFNNQLNASQLYGSMADAQQSQRNAQSGLQLSAAGQLGQQAMAGQSIRNDSANAANSQYNANNANQLAALGLSSNIYNQGVANQFQNSGLKLDAANAQTTSQQNQQNQLLQALGMAPQINDLRYADAQKLGQVGAAQDAYQDLLLQGQMAAWDQTQNKQWANVGNMASLLTGGGFNTTTSTKPVYSNPVGSALSSIGSLASLFMACDIRLKQNIRPVGTMDNGIRLYSFTYIDDPKQQITIGPLAQEVEITHPEAVFTRDDGMKIVNMETLH